MQLGKFQVNITVHIEVAPGKYELPKVELRDKAGLIHVCGPVTLPIFQMNATGARLAKRRVRAPTVSLKQFFNTEMSYFKEIRTPY